MINFLTHPGEQRHCSCIRKEPACQTEIGQIFRLAIATGCSIMKTINQTYNLKKNLRGQSLERRHLQGVMEVYWERSRQCFVQVAAEKSGSRQLQ